MCALNDDFEREFWSGTSLNELFASPRRTPSSPAPWSASSPAACASTRSCASATSPTPGTLLDGARRAMRASFQRELDAAEQNLSFLATVGSVSPYVGLFGTVWGIMHAFTGLAALSR
jgi:biopolymer transport protein TolQ